MTLPTIADRLEQTLLLEPPFAAPGWTLTVLGEGSFLGRSVFEIRAERTDAAPFHPYWQRVPQFTATIDGERGLPLRLAAIVDGAVAVAITARSIHFDEPIRDDVFRFDPPPDTIFVKVD